MARLPDAYAYHPSRWVNIGIGVDGQVYVPNHLLPNFSQLGYGRQVLGQLRIVEGPEIVYRLGVTNAPVTGAGRFSGTFEQTPLQSNLLNPVGPPLFPPTPDATLATTPGF
jgi:hypothetical protein